MMLACSGAGMGIHTRIARLRAGRVRHGFAGSSWGLEGWGGTKRSWQNAEDFGEEAAGGGRSGRRRCPGAIVFRGRTVSPNSRGRAPRLTFPVQDRFCLPEENGSRFAGPGLTRSRDRRAFDVPRRGSVQTSLRRPDTVFNGAMASLDREGQAKPVYPLFSIRHTTAGSPSPPDQLIGTDLARRKNRTRGRHPRSGSSQIPERPAAAGRKY